MSLNLDAIEARANAATEGPWRLYDGKRDNRDAAVETAWSYDTDGGDTELITDWCHAADANFIANARTDVPALLALVREQQAQIERVANLHAPIAESDDDEPYCRHCKQAPYGHAPYPCPTIAALTATEARE